MVKEKTNMYLLSIVSIVAVDGIVVLVLNSAGSVSYGSGTDVTGQALTIGDDLPRTHEEEDTCIGELKDCLDNCERVIDFGDQYIIKNEWSRCKNSCWQTYFSCSVL